MIDVSEQNEILVDTDSIGITDDEEDVYERAIGKIRNRRHKERRRDIQDLFINPAV